MLLFIAMYSEDTRHWRSKVSEDCSSLPPHHSRSSSQGLPVLHPGWSASLRVSSGCAGPPSSTAPVLFHGPALWSPPSLFKTFLISLEKPVSIYGRHTTLPHLLVRFYLMAGAPASIECFLWPEHYTAKSLTDIHWSQAVTIYEGGISGCKHPVNVYYSVCAF